MEDIFFPAINYSFTFLNNYAETFVIFLYVTETKYAKHKKWNKMVYDASLYGDWFKSYSLFKLKMVASSYM